MTVLEVITEFESQNSLGANRFARWAPKGATASFVMQLERIENEYGTHTDCRR